MDTNTFTTKENWINYTDTIQIFLFIPTIYIMRRATTKNGNLMDSVLCFYNTDLIIGLSHPLGQNS